MKIVYRRSAIADLAEISDYIRQENPSASRRVGRRIRTVIDRLADFPHSGRVGVEPGTRELVVSGLPYLVVYQIGSEKIEIIAIFHMARQRQPVAPGET